MLKLDYVKIMINVIKIFFRVAADEIKLFFFFPVWWYTLGFAKMVKKSELLILEFEQFLGFRIWLKNIFVPMFGQRDLSGRIISFFLRFFMILGKGFILLLAIIMAIIFNIIWLLLPPFILYQAFIHIY